MVIWIIIWMVFISEIQAHRYAICISGQTSRMMPEFVIKSLIIPNSHQYLVLFFNLQSIQRNTTSGSQLQSIYNTGHGYNDTIYRRMTELQIHQHLNNLFDVYHNTTIANIKFMKPLTRKDWCQYFFQRPYCPLERISQYLIAQPSILNMYAHQVNCSNQILSYERSHQKVFDYIISIREDTFFFKPIILKSISKILLHKKCDVITKNCLTWDGINMRFQLLNRHSGWKLLNQRLNYYRLRYQLGSIHNPERFELAQLKYNKLKWCGESIEMIPATAARFIRYQKQMDPDQNLTVVKLNVENIEYCLLSQEGMLSDCYPKGFETFVRLHTCPNASSSALHLKN